MVSVPHRHADVTQVLMTLPFSFFEIRRSAITPSTALIAFAPACALRRTSLSVFPSPHTVPPRYTKLSPESVSSPPARCPALPSGGLCAALPRFFSILIFSPCLVNNPFHCSSDFCSSCLPFATRARSSAYRSFVLPPFVIIFLLMRSSTSMNSSGLSMLPCLNPTLTSNSSDAPPTTTLALNHPHFCFWYSHPPQCSHHHLSGYCVKSFLQVDEPQSHNALYLQSVLQFSLSTYTPSAVPLPFLNPCYSSPKSPSTHSSPDPCV